MPHATEAAPASIASAQTVGLEYVSVPERLTMPILPGRWMWPGMIPILHSPGVITPGQLGPTSTTLS